MDEVLSNLNKDEVKKLVKYMMNQAEIVASGGVTGTQPPPRLELLPIDFKLNGPATYSSCSHRITNALCMRRSRSKPDGSREEEGAKAVFTKEDQILLEILRRKQRAIDDKKSAIKNTPTSFMPRVNIATYAYSAERTSNTYALACTPEWINDFLCI